MSKPICPRCGSERICCVWEATITAEVMELIIDEDNGVVDIVPGKTIKTSRTSYPVAHCNKCGWSK
jgi:predicted RNA-binding Zn-ribbon protein involved in translation (DUF1610 family)